MTLAIACLAVFPLLAQPVAPQASAARILVIPFDNTRHEPRLHWMSEASVVLLADELNALGLRAITRAERIRAFEQLHLPPTASLSRATVIKVGQLVGASEVIIGSIAFADGDLSVDAHSIRIDVGRLQPEVRGRAPLPDLFKLFEQLAKRLAPDAHAPDVPRTARPPLDAFENYIKGLIAESPAAQATFLETAVRQYPGYDRAQLALWEVRTDQGNHAAALSAARAVAASSPLARHARFHAGVSLLELERYEEAFDTLTALVDTTSSPAGGRKPNGAVFNNLGVVQIRRGATPQAGTPTFYLTKAADADPGDPDYLFNLGYAYALERNNQAAVYWLREALRRNTADADAHYVLAAALQATGSSVEAAREKELARQLSSQYEAVEAPPAADKAPVPKGLERLRSELDTPWDLRPEQTIVDSAQRETRELATFHLDRGRRLFEREEDREAMDELRRAVYLSPYAAQAHLLIGRIHLRGGRPEAAVEALKISVWSEDTATARVALAEAYMKLQKPEAAKTELQRALVLDPASAEAKRMLADIK
jgi:tetratricopeptide (TPR) repeat protein